MNPNSQIDNYIFNFPNGFVPEPVEDRYKIHLKNFHKPYVSILDYINSNIKSITLPGLNASHVSQKKLYGKEVKYRGSKSPYDLSDNTFELIIRNTDHNIIYFILEDIFYYHFIKIGVPYINDFYIYILDNLNNHHLQIKLSEILFTSIPPLTLSHNEKEVTEKTLSLKFEYNYKDIEYLLDYDSENNGTLLDNYSEIIKSNSNE